MKQLTLSNWVKLIINPVAWATSFTCLILVWAWSRYENKDNRWISHFLEHMFFKWAKKYKNAKEVSTVIDMTWWECNAFTWKEYAWYYIKCTNRHAEIAFDVLSDMLLNPAFDSSEIDKERWVIIEEMNMYLDMPKYQVAWEFEELIIWDQPLWWDQLWTKEVIQTVTSQDFHNYRNLLYTTDNLVISLAWDITEQKWVELAEKYFSSLWWSIWINLDQLAKNDSNERIRIINKNTEQSHIVIWAKWTPWNDMDNFWSQKVFATLLWWMMSSRMFLNIREAKWLCYYISSHTDDYTDFWIVSTSAWVDNSRIDEAVELIVKEYRDIANERVSEGELTKAKNFLIGRTLLSLEDSESRAHMYWKQALLLDKIYTEDEIIKNIDKVSSEDLFNLANMMFAKDKIYIAWIGPLENKKELWTDIINK